MRRISMLGPVFALLLAACGGEEATPSAGGQQEEAQQQATAAIEVARTSLGDIVVDSDGNTLYIFVPDQEQNGEPTCYDECAETWPPLEATGEPSAGEGIDAALLGSVERTDGAMQVTYKDLPLYYFSGDEAAGDTNGQGLNDVWWVVAPDGSPVREKQKSNGMDY